MQNAHLLRFKYKLFHRDLRLLGPFKDLIVYLQANIFFPFTPRRPLNKFSVLSGSRDVFIFRTCLRGFLCLQTFDSPYFKNQTKKERVERLSQ